MEDWIGRELLLELRSSKGEAEEEARTRPENLLGLRLEVVVEKIRGGGRGGRRGSRGREEEKETKEGRVAMERTFTTAPLTFFSLSLLSPLSLFLSSSAKCQSPSSTVTNSNHENHELKKPNVRVDPSNSQPAYFFLSFLFFSFS